MPRRTSHGCQLDARIEEHPLGDIWSIQRRTGADFATELLVLRDELVRGPRLEQVREFARQYMLPPRHPAACKLLALSKDGERYALMLEAAAGEPVGAMEPREAAALGAQLAAGLDHVHRRGVVHGALTPNDVRIADGRAQLRRFGLARLAAALEPTRAGGLDMMDARYAAPERYRDEPVEAPADLYALGGVLLRAKTGADPFAEHQSILTLSAAKLAGALPRLEGQPPLMGELLSPDPTRRPTASIAARRLAACASGEPPRGRFFLALHRDPRPLFDTLLDLAGIERTEDRFVRRHPRDHELTLARVGGAAAGYRWSERRDLETSALPLACCARTHGLQGIELFADYELHASGQTGFSDLRNGRLELWLEGDEARETFFQAWTRAYPGAPAPELGAEG